MMKPHFIPIPGLTGPQMKDLLSQEALLRLVAPRLLTPREAKQIKFTLVGERLHIEGPRELLEKMARRLSKLGATGSKNPYGP